MLKIIAFILLSGVIYFLYNCNKRREEVYFLCRMRDSCVKYYDSSILLYAREDTSGFKRCYKHFDVFYDSSKQVK